MSDQNNGIIVLDKKDNVGVTPSLILPKDKSVDRQIPKGHKVALSDIEKGAPIVKFGNVIGFSTCDIIAGDHVHTHNLEFGETKNSTIVGRRFKKITADQNEVSDTFMGIRRSNGSVGTRNFIAVLTSVNCSATVATLIANNFPKEELADFENIDGIAPFVHGTGCGLNSDGIGFANLQRVLWGYARNPNVGGVLMVGLGCEVAQTSFLLEAYGIEQGPLFRVLNIQSSGGTNKSVEKGISAVREMLPVVNRVERTPEPVSKLRLALQCGGSDAWSGITANPALGFASDILISKGGTSVLAETPEIYGAEHLLIERAETPKVADKIEQRIEWWKNYTAINDGSLDNNPSPGNKLGGISTILEKSLGAVAKSGQSGLVDVLQYGEMITSNGLNFMDSPGFDPVSVTGQIASGCNIVCFTTGRGSAFGSKPSPTIKLSSTSQLYDRMFEDIDINCGSILDGELTVEEMGYRIYNSILDIASGKPSKSELLGLGDLEFVPWQVGATM